MNRRWLKSLHVELMDLDDVQLLKRARNHGSSGTGLPRQLFDTLTALVVLLQRFDESDEKASATPGRRSS